MKVAFAEGFFDSLKKCFRPWWHPRELWYQIKCRVWYRYNTVRARELPFTWQDRSHLLPHIMFEILGQFIEGECSPGHIEWYGEYGHKIFVAGVEKYVRDEMQELWDWWREDYLKGYPAKEDALMDEIHKLDEEFLIDHFRMGEGEDEGHCFFDPQYKTEEAGERVNELFREYSRLEKEAEEELGKRLHRLIDIRESMWT